MGISCLSIFDCGSAVLNWLYNKIAMKILSLLLLAMIFSNQLMAQNIGIGTNTPNPSALLDVSSTSKGMLVPRMTTAQRTAITSPAQGLMVYDTDVKSFWYHNGTAWTNLAGSGGFSLPYEGTVNLANPGFKVTNSGFGPAIQAVTTNEFGFALQASNTTNYGYSVYAYSRSPNAIGIYSYVDSSTAIKGSSTNGIGLQATSTDSIAIRAAIIKGANADPVILATHAGVGIAVDASSNTGSAVRGISNGSTLVQGSVVGINNHATAGNGVYGSALGAGGAGVRGESTAGTGVLGYSNDYIGVSGGTLGGIGVNANSLSGTALQGSSSSGYALSTSGKVKIAGGNTNPAAGAVLTSLDASGNAVWKQPNKVAFRATGIYSGLNVIPDFTIRKLHFPSEQYDYANSFELTSSTSPTTDMSNFVAPLTGLYHFEASVSLQLSDLADDFTGVYLDIMIKRGANFIRVARGQTPCCEPQGFGASVFVSTDCRLLIGDDVYVEINQSNDASVGATISNNSFETYFCGRLIAAD
jgi:hypothetical protein